MSHYRPSTGPVCYVIEPVPKRYIMSLIKVPVQYWPSTICVYTAPIP